MYDYIIIGAGVIGSAIARELSKYKVKVLVLEKENDVANVQSLANSAIIHAGHNPQPGSLKAILSIKGNKMYDTWEKELNIPLLRTGAFVVAHDQEEEAMLMEFVKTTKANKVPEYHVLSGDEARKLEPNLAKSITKVLSLPTTKVTYPWEVAFACMENAIENGVEFLKNKHVCHIQAKDNYFILETKDKSRYESIHIINAAGVASDDIGGMIEQVPFKIKPRKGEYFVLDRRVKGFVNHVIYPLPSDRGKGVLLTPQVHGNILIGPSSEYVDDKFHANTSEEGLAYVKAHAHDLAENIPYQQIIRSFAGIRSSSDYPDFYIKASKNYDHFYYLGGIESPGLTAAPAIASYVVDDLMEVGSKYDINPSFNPYRKGRIEFHRLDTQAQETLLKEDKRYGRIICKCEKITEKEIIDAIQGPLGSHTVKGVKKRVRAGAGLCQGGYCEEKIVNIIKRELGLDPLNIRYDDQGSALFVEETKGGYK